MVEIDKIKALIEMMVEGDLAQITLRDGEQRIDIRRNKEHAAGNGAAPHGMVGQPGMVGQSGMFMHHQPVQHGPASNAPPELPAPPPVEDKLLAIESPMVGTFYSAPSPGQPPFVSVGSEVSSDTVVCILEAMKVFNEIKAEVTGRIEKILVKNGDSVEFGQKMFLLKP